MLDTARVRDRKLFHRSAPLESSHDHMTRLPATARATAPATATLSGIRTRCLPVRFVAARFLSVHLRIVEHLCWHVSEEYRLCAEDGREQSAQSTAAAEL